MMRPVVKLSLEDDRRTIDVLKEVGMHLASVQPESEGLDGHFKSQSISLSVSPGFRPSKGEPCLASKVKEADRDAVMEGESHKKNSSPEAHGHDLESQGGGLDVTSEDSDMEDPRKVWEVGKSLGLSSMNEIDVN